MKEKCKTPTLKNLQRLELIENIRKKKLTTKFIIVKFENIRTKRTF